MDFVILVLGFLTLSVVFTLLLFLLFYLLLFKQRSGLNMVRGIVSFTFCNDAAEGLRV